MLKGKSCANSMAEDLEFASIASLSEMVFMTELPAAITGPSAWFGPDMAARTDWIEPLSQADISEIEVASQRLAQREIDWQTLRREDFPLPELQPRLRLIMDEVLEGRGFALLRGLPVERWGQRLSAIAFLGLGR